MSSRRSSGSQRSLYTIIIFSNLLSYTVDEPILIWSSLHKSLPRLFLNHDFVLVFSNKADRNIESGLTHTFGASFGKVTLT